MEPSEAYPSPGKTAVPAAAEGIRGLEFEAPFWRSLDTFCAAHGGTPEEAIRAAWQVLIARRTGFDTTLSPQQTVADVMTGPGNLDNSYRGVRLKTLDASGDLALRLVFDPANVTDSTVSDLAAGFEALLRAIPQHPETPLKRLPVIGPHERRRLLDDFARERSIPLDATPVLRQIAEQVAQHPKAPAVEDSEIHLSYRELSDRADAVARRLHARGVGAGVPVALLCERSALAMVGMLGILRSGGVYVPLDVTYPGDRLLFMLGDVRATVILTRSGLADALPTSGLPRLLLDDDSAENAPLTFEDPAPEDLAYVIYTSGSSGRPKGVAVTHRNLALSNNARAAFYREPVERYLLVSALAFDSSVAGLFWTLATGGTLVLPPDDFQKDLETFARLTEDSRASHLLCTPGLYSVLLEQCDPRRLETLRTVMVGGDTCSPSLVLHHQQTRPKSRLFNEYGPTEGTVWSTGEDTTGSPADRRIPIGRPIVTEHYLLDPRGDLVPVMTPGELYMGGGAITRGYLGRPALTARHFVPDPWSDEPGVRLYRTGDRLRFLPDGRLDFLGRVDRQVKVRGYRIEPGEIEGRLIRLEAVAQAVVIPLGTDADRRLAAFVVTQADATLQTAELRDHLHGDLPDHMVPTTWTILDRLPLTENGKVDFKALAELESRVTDTDQNKVAPRDENEATVVMLFEEVLGLEGLSVTADFLEAGGNSLIATRLAARLREIFGVQISLFLLFEHPTVAELAVALLNLRQADGADIPPLPTKTAEGPAPLSFAQERLWFFERLNPGSNANNLLYPVLFEGPLAMAALAFALEELRHRHRVLRAAFDTEGEAGRQHFAGPRKGEFLPLVDLSSLPDAAQETARLERTLEARPFDLGGEPLMRSVVLRRSPEHHRLLLVIHQIVFDGWSQGIFLREFAALYRAALEGRSADLPPLPFQYTDFARWQRDWLTDAVLETQLERFKQHLGNRPAVAEIPTDFPRHQGKTSLIGHARFTFPLDVSSRLKAESRRQGATLFMTFLTGLQVLIHRYTGAERVTVGSLLAGRSHPGIENLIGFFISTLPLLTDLSEDPTFQEALGRARTTALLANDHQDLPFERLIEAVQPARSASGHAFYQVLLTFLNIDRGGMELPGLTITPVPTDEGAMEAEFDLNPVVFEDEGRLSLLMAYSRDLFGGTTIFRMLRHWSRILLHGLEEPSRRLSALSLMTPEERHQITHEWSLPAAGSPPERAIRELVDHQGEKSVRVVDSKDRPVPIGILGRLVVEGAAHPERAVRWTAQGLLAAPPSTPAAAQAVTASGDEQEAGRRNAAALRAEVGARRSKLSAKKRGLLAARLRRKKSARAAKKRVIPPRPEGVPIPLTFSQERIWFLQQFDPESNAYHMLDLARLGGDLSTAALERALHEIVERHEALRSVFLEREGGPVQEVRPVPEGLLQHQDLTHLPAEKRFSAALENADREACRPFDLTTGPLLRVCLYRLGPEEHLLALINHHLISDDWSSGVFIRELATLYQAFSIGEPSPLAPLEIQYGDFAVWQRGEAAAKMLDKQLAYWLEQMQGIPHLLELPTDRPRPAIRTDRGQRLVRHVPRATVERLENLARGAEATLFMALLAGINILLTRLSGQRELLVGSPIANRNRTEVEGLLGLFLNSLIMRGDCTGNPDFPELLRRVRITTLEAYAHQDLPFERLVKEIQPERSLAHSPLFQVLIQLQNTPKEAVKLPSLTLEPVELHGQTAKFDLLLSLTETPEGLHCMWESSLDLFEPTTIARWAGLYEALLQGLSTSPELGCWDLPWLTESARQQVTLEWNDTTVRLGGPLAGEATLVSLFLLQVERTPEAEAIAFGDDCLTYRELAIRSAALATHLHGFGCSSETVVGVALERSLDMMVALWGVLMAGAAYLPLDVEYPPERLTFMVDDAAPRVVLTQGHLREALPPLNADVVVVDALDPAPSPTGQESPVGPLDSGCLAYIIYTSGSTGRPKGAMIAHRSIVNRLAWMQAAYGLTPGETVLQKTPVSFDVSVWELFWPTLVGARLVLAAPGGHRDSAYLLDLILREEVRVLHFVPSMLQVFLEEQDLERAQGLRLVVASGEALAPELVQQVDIRLDAALHNLYGPTEAAVDVTSWPCDRGVRRTVPIGRPIANTSIHQVDPRLRPVPVGVPSELLIGGRNVGRGYLGRPALTAEKFVPDPFSHLPGQRLYRTGDLTRTGVDGVIEFLGRLDHQVKVRGFRIELGEIETALTDQPALREAAVLVRGDGVHKRLVAYVVPEVAEHLEAPHGLAEELVERLDNSLGDRLPEYMVPQLWVGLERMPLTPNGKLDRRALPSPTAAGRRQAEFVAPSTPEEKTLAGIWAEVLGLETVGAADNFFTLGGDSILSIQVSTRARAAGLAVPPRLLFQHPTVAGLAKAAQDGPGPATEDLASRPFEEAGLGEAALEEVLARLVEPGQDPREAVEDLYELSPMQQGMLFHSLLAPETEVFCEQYTFTLEGDLDTRALEEAWGQVVKRHAILRTSFVWGHENKPFQAVHRHVSLSWRREDWRELDEATQQEALEKALLEDRRRGFDLSRAPALRLALFRLANKRRVFMCQFHHILMDGWCLPILFREVFSLYDALQNGSEVHFDEPRPYRDYIGFLRRQQAGAAEDFWRRQMAGFEAPTPLPLDHPSAESAGANLERSLDLPRAETEALETFARRHQVTLSTLLQAAWALLLRRAGGSDTVVFGITVSGRPAELEGVESMVGLFINTLPQRVTVDPSRPLVPWLQELQRIQAEAREHQHVPLARIQSASDLPSGQDLFESLVAFENFPVHASEEAMRHNLGVTGGSVAETTNFPLTLFSAPPKGTARTMPLSLAYDPKRFTARGIDQLLGHLRNVLATVARTDADRPLGTLSLLTALERDRLIHRFNDTAVEYGAPAKTLHELIELQVRRDPQAVALVFEGETCTYEELNSRADLLAHHLRQRGAGPETVVAVLLERSFELMSALLGTFKAGAAYLPLDSGYPRDRLAFMLADARPAALITTAGLLAETLPGASEDELPILHIDDPNLAEEPATPRTPLPRVDDRGLAYVIYTSGSTGRPKGVMLSHRGIVNRLLWKQATYALAPNDTILQKTPVSFDVSVWELFVPLMSGARMVLARPEGHRDNRYLAELMAREEVTVVHFVPSMLRPFLETPGIENLSALRLVVASGEALPRELARRFAERLDARLDNLYGPTEASVDVTFWRSVPETDPEAPSVPIGVPIANTSIHLLDAWGEPAPLGFPAALMIGGTGLARGYLSRPSLTAERFLPDPFSPPGARLYATGDLAQRLGAPEFSAAEPDGDNHREGAIEFLGRLDGQVKLRGQRIELGEIEAALTSHPAVATAVAGIFGETPNERLVVHWLATQGAAAATVDDLRTFLRETLPPAMIPAEFVALDQLPLTPSGKVDRRALPEPSQAAKPARTEPLNPVEESLLELCSELLDGVPVHIEDNFFLVGGNSINAITLVARLEERFQVEISLAEMFAATTLQELGTWILQRQAQDEDEDAMAALLAELEDLPDDEALGLLHEHQASEANTS